MINTITKKFVAPDGDSIELNLNEYDVNAARRALLEQGRASHFLENSPMSRIAGTDHHAIERSWVVEAYLDGFDMVYLAKKSAGDGKQVWASRTHIELDPGVM